MIVLKKENTLSKQLKDVEARLSQQKSLLEKEKELYHKSILHIGNEEKIHLDQLDKKRELQENVIHQIQSHMDYSLAELDKTEEVEQLKRKSSIEKKINQLLLREEKLTLKIKQEKLRMKRDKPAFALYMGVGSFSIGLLFLLFSMWLFPIPITLFFFVYLVTKEKYISPNLRSGSPLL